MRIHLGSAPAIVVSSAAVAEEIVRTHDIAFSNRLESRIYKRLLYDRKDLLMAPYGEYWRQIRGVCATQLLSLTRVQSLHNIREEETDLMIQKIRQFGSYPFNLSQALEKVTNDIVCRASLGKRYSKEEEDSESHSKLHRVFQELNSLLGLFNIGEYIPWLDLINNFNGVNQRVEKNYHELDELLEEIIEDHVANRAADRSKENGIVLLDVLLDGQNSQKEFSITRDSIKAIVLDVFAGGSDTTYVVLEWTMTELLRHPEALNKVQKEVRRIVGSKARVTRDDLAKMSYLKAVLKESMRLHPSVPLIPRASTQDVVVNVALQYLPAHAS
uniref:Cytochrome P450 n=1 Tax=Kalanchoe fedtschenkoi TaxID=63787 RepID=A0A7N0VDT2_KALFE